MFKNTGHNRQLIFSLSLGLVFFCFLSVKSVKAATDQNSSSSSKNLVGLEKIDSDHDGLSDALELKFKTNPLNPDSDSDGYKDGEEVDWGYNPLSSSTKKLAQKIIIDLKKQKLKYLVSDVILKEFPISSGKASMKTPSGTFKIVNKSKKAWSNTYKLWMPYWLGFSNGNYGIHELPIWPNGYREGANHLGKPVSHGCVRLGTGAAQYIYERVAVGISIIIN
ncbi:MAG: L,D-transpeptidase family protein [Patescibacteria group bacterium]